MFFVVSFPYFHVGNLHVLKVILNFCFKAFYKIGLLLMKYAFYFKFQHILYENGNINEVFSALAACMQGYNTVL